MKKRLINANVVAFAIGMLASTGCTPSNEPTGPEKGSIQAYLDQNPEAAARIDENVEADEDD